MQLHVRLFANLREIFEAQQITMEAPDGLEVNGVVPLLMARYPEAVPALTNVMVAVNQVLAPPHAVLHPSDEIALLPPVGGGSVPIEDNQLLKISSAPLVVEEAYRHLEDVNHGGTVIFVGTVREWTRDKQTAYLSYEAYESMALSQMQQIQAEVEAQFDGVTTLQWHRVGKLNPLDIAVICGASSPHRNSAFEAARTLIERLKKEVTIWKKEVYTDGDSVWQENAQSTSVDEI
ncbi:molybdenum cofactor biosynthesis protein MoaE [Alicyclobacillus fastidiosus]|uniref:Molybdenum cofactor biosynthesis protein MoaE n=1 Tax=Alicyclobacillus fastidiosus TaxID=392011 RepID=A0ABY6ZPG3_9BACL|nr:molybdenum cofactor biosynthesis protein MoaE [Alicyclobacillus fastidiosus]WAH44332.1 molybdenum cofactor biosynthesis protein MoaE [Alicyclobacillus fastidiosus]GMA60661.1 molybdopterin synthase sulfur carrier subunit [Alicyclobacillus fastidiosus]